MMALMVMLMMMTSVMVMMLMFFLTKAFADQVGNLVSKLEEVANKLVTSASISRPSQQLADLLRHLWSNVVLIRYYNLQWSNLVSIRYYHLQYGVVSLFLAPSNCSPRGKSCLQGWVRSSRWRFCPCCPSGRTPPRSSSPAIKFKFGQKKKKPPLKSHRSSAWRGSFDSQSPRRCLSLPTITLFAFPALAPMNKYW